MVKGVLAETGFPPDRLEIEIAEGVLIDDVPATRFLLEELSEAGVQIALDDFGTVYSSLSYVRALPLKRFKIDRSFVFEIEGSEAQSIVLAIVSLCQQLDLEGVESQHAVKILWDWGCDVLQGYFYSRPLDAGAFDDLANLGCVEKAGARRRSRRGPGWSTRSLLLGWRLRWILLGMCLAWPRAVDPFGLAYGYTQPERGWLDGALGVIAWLEVARAAKEAGGPPVSVVSFQDEEGRFGAITCNAVLLGRLSLNEADQKVDADGVSLGAAREVMAGMARDIWWIQGAFPGFWRCISSRGG